MAGKQILKNSEILNRVEINGENNCFILLKDHKDLLKDRNSYFNVSENDKNNYQPCNKIIAI